METILVPNQEVSSDSGCLTEYLKKNRVDTKKFLPGDSAIQDSKVFEANVFNTSLYK